MCASVSPLDNSKEQKISEEHEKHENMTDTISSHLDKHYNEYKKLYLQKEFDNRLKNILLIAGIYEIHLVEYIYNDNIDEDLLSAKEQENPENVEKFFTYQISNIINQLEDLYRRYKNDIYQIAIIAREHKHKLQKRFEMLLKSLRDKLKRT